MNAADSSPASAIAAPKQATRCKATVLAIAAAEVFRNLRRDSRGLRFCRSIETDLQARPPVLTKAKPMIRNSACDAGASRKGKLRPSQESRTPFGPTSCSLVAPPGFADYAWPQPVLSATLQRIPVILRITRSADSSEPRRSVRFSKSRPRRTAPGWPLTGRWLKTSRTRY